MTIFIFLGLFLLQSCGLFRTETFLIPADLKPRWISVEYANPKCPPLSESKMSREFVVPESGFICTSSPRLTTAYQRTYFLVGAKGERTQLKAKEQIWVEATNFFDEPSLDEGMPRCKVTLDQFFYGSKEDLIAVPQNPIMKDEKFLIEYHPECRNKGTSIPKQKP